MNTHRCACDHLQMSLFANLGKHNELMRSNSYLI